MSTFAIPNENNTFEKQKSGAIAQLVEQRTENPCVPGSIPGGTTKTSVETLLLRFFYSHCFTKTGLGERCGRTLSLLVIPSFKEIAVLVNDGSKLGDFRADFDTIVTKTCTFM